MENLKVPKAELRANIQSNLTCCVMFAISSFGLIFSLRSWAADSISNAKAITEGNNGAIRSEERRTALGLGIIWKQTSKHGWIVSSVIAGSAADDAGIKVNDSLIDFSLDSGSEAKHIQNPIFMKGLPNDTVSIQLSRNGEKLEKMLKFSTSSDEVELRNIIKNLAQKANALNALDNLLEQQKATFYLANCLSDTTSIEKQKEAVSLLEQLQRDSEKQHVQPSRMFVLAVSGKLCCLYYRLKDEKLQESYASICSKAQSIVSNSYDIYAPTLTTIAANLKAVGAKERATELWEILWQKNIDFSKWNLQSTRYTFESLNNAYKASKNYEKLEALYLSAYKYFRAQPNSAGDTVAILIMLKKFYGDRQDLTQTNYCQDELKKFAHDYPADTSGVYYSSFTENRIKLGAEFQPAKK